MNGIAGSFLFDFTALSLPSVPQQSKRLTPPAIALRSKSMTSELEEMGTVLQTHINTPYVHINA